MKNSERRFTIKQSFILSYLIPGLLLVILLVGSMTLLAFYARLGSRPFLIAAIIYTLVMAALYVAASIYIYWRMRSIYYDGLYRTTAILLRNLKSNVTSEEKYPTTSVAEINELNKDLSEVNTIISNSTMISSDLESAYIPLVFISEDERLVTLQSFKNELRALIYCSQNFRNVLLEVFYDLDEDTLTKEESIRILKVLRDAFSDYQHFLFVPNDNGTGFYMFLPRVDSFSHIQERLIAAMKNLSVAKKTFDGLATINARFSVVCYPYSNINELFPDLLYAKRQGQVMYIYLPNRLSALSESRILQNSLNLNNMSRVLEHLTDLKVSSRERNKSFNVIKDTLKSIASYLDIDYAGVILYDEINNRYYSKTHIATNKDPLFAEGTFIEKPFIEALESVKDKDNSFYFSSRRHAGHVLARYLDKINISGGFYYLVHDQGQVLGIIYFLNKIKDLNVDSYIRESLYILSYRIGDFLMVTNEEDKVIETYREINNVLMSSDLALYRVDRITHDLVGFSYHFNTLFPKAKIGEKCYHSLYGLDAPCVNCPLKTYKKMISEIKGDKIETSLTINESKTKLIRMLVRQISKESDFGDRFDRDLLINSHYSLRIAMDDLYSAGARGYLLVLRIDNMEALIKDAGSEGYLFILRQFISNLKMIKVSNSNIFHYSTQAIAILMPEIGQRDIINFIEKIYDVSKQKYESNSVEYSFDLTYLPYTFPQQYATGEDFLKYVLRHFNSLNYTINKDMITLPDSDYSRSASRNEFMLSVIDDQFGNKTFSVALQPFVKAGDKAIYGAELLIRLSDNYRNSVLDAFELIRVAGRNGKISLISNALIKYIGEIYKQYGLTVFKISGFQRLTINTDYSFFEDPNFFKTLFDVFTEYSFQRDFLGFEITEREVYQHLSDFKKMAKGILNHHIVLICDQYSGEFLSIDTLKELGFTEMKIGRSLVGDIEINPKHWNEIMSLDKLAQEHDMRICFVGVENADQYVMLRDMDKNCYCQGYHFYKPLEDYKLIEELRKNK